MLDEYAARSVAPDLPAAALEGAARCLLPLPAAGPSHVVDTDTVLALLRSLRVEQAMQAHEGTWGHGEWNACKK